MSTEQSNEPTGTETPEEKPVTGAEGNNAAPTPLDVKKASADSWTALNEYGYPDETKVEDMTDKQQAAYWKHQSRKHEGRAKALKNANPDDDLQTQIAELQANLAARDLADAFKDVRISHPELGDDDLKLCSSTDPDEVRKWGDAFSAVLAAHNAKSGGETDDSGPDARTHVILPFARSGGSNKPDPSTPAKGSSDRQKLYEEALHRYDKPSK